jgi:hypothetical protein
MSYASGAAVQAAVFQLLAGDAELAELVDGIHDAAPPGTPQGTYLILGEEEALDRGDGTGPGAEHRLTVSVVSDASGFLVAKQAAGRVSEVLTCAEPALASGRVVAIWFQDLRARRLEGGTLRRIDLRFRVRVEGEAA